MPSSTNGRSSKPGPGAKADGSNNIDGYVRSMKKRKKKEKKYLDQIDISGILEQRARFEKRIVELGGKIPKPWPGPDRSGALRNLQLLERVEQLERRHKRTNTTSNAGGHDGAGADVTVQAGPRESHNMDTTIDEDEDI